MTRLLPLLLLLTAGLLLSATSAQAATDEQLLAVYLQSALSAFPAPDCPTRTVHLRADAALDAQYPGDGALGMGADSDPRRPEPCTVWLHSGMGAGIFRYVLYHEMAHTAGWQHSTVMEAVAMEAAIARALSATADPLAPRAKRTRRSSHRNRRQSFGRTTSAQARQRASVPLPPHLTIVRDPATVAKVCEARACADGTTVYLGADADRFDRWHETGHVFDAQVLTDADRAYFTRLMRLAGDWTQTGQYVLGQWSGGDRSPDEWFADWYGNAKLGCPFPRNCWTGGYADSPDTDRQFRRFLSRVRGAYRRLM